MQKLYPVSNHIQTDCFKAVLLQGKSVELSRGLVQLPTP